VELSVEAVVTINIDGEEGNIYKFWKPRSAYISELDEELKKSHNIREGYKIIWRGRAVSLRDKVRNFNPASFQLTWKKKVQNLIKEFRISIEDEFDYFIQAETDWTGFQLKGEVSRA
jgi:hypothetical protein